MQSSWKSPMTRPRSITANVHGVSGSAHSGRTIPRTKCASSPGGTRPPDVRHRREGRVHRHDGRHRGGIEVIVDLGGVEACDGDGRKEEVSSADRVSASLFRTSAPPTISARMARRPVPAEGSSTRDAGPMAAAVRAAKPSGVGVENCWKASLSAERRVWVGRRPAILVKAESREVGESALRNSAFPYLRRNRTVAASQAS